MKWEANEILKNKCHSRENGNLFGKIPDQVGNDRVFYECLALQMQ